VDGDRLAGGEHGCEMDNDEWDSWTTYLPNSAQYIPAQITLANDIFSTNVRGEKETDIPYGVEIRSWERRGLLRSFVLRIPLANSSKTDI
jgi:hypothetical protein